jgi:dimethylaniline monooxygenase (N-oxide forming)
LKVLTVEGIEVTFSLMANNIDPREGSVAVIGSGTAGLITAHTLLKDGFNVQLISRDHTPGGVWAEEHIYPGLRLNK